MIEIPKEPSASGYFNRTKLGVLPGLTNEEESPFKQRGTEISNINGWYINTNIR